MRKLILIATVLTSLSVAPSAHAQITVYDPTGLLAQAKSLYQELQSYTTQLAQLQQEIQTVTWAATTAQSLIQNPNLGTAMALMGQLGLSQDLPVNPMQIQGLLTGVSSMNSLSSITGAFSSLNGLVNSSWSANHVYTCNDQSWNCQQQQQQANSAAGLQGTMGTLYQDLANHIQILQALRTSAGTATDPAQRENVMLEAALENSWAQNTGAQLNSAVGTFMAQKQAATDRDEEQFTKSIDAVIAAKPN